MAVAFEIAFAVAVFLFGMGIRNRHSGWRKRRRDMVTDTLMIWAKATSELRATAPVPDPGNTSAAVPLAISEQLCALNHAVSANAGARVGVRLNTALKDDPEPATRTAQ
jgi:hypothetical protein